MAAGSGVYLDLGEAPEPSSMEVGMSNRMSFTTTDNTLTPASPMSNPHSPATRRPSYPATSPLQQTSPKPSPVLRRTTSATALHERPTSSPNLARKSSRTSLGAQPEDAEKRLTPKRSISNLISGLRDAQSRMEAIEEPVPLTAPQIAVQHFTRELKAHEVAESTADTAVILHDACYGHRYSRPKTTKSTLSMIVERPERIHASVLGASTAYVRLGAHHSGGKNAPHPNKALPAPPPFTIRRTSRSMDITSSYVTNVHGTAWMSELRTLCNAAGERLAAGVKELSRSSTPTEPEKRQLHEGDLYLSTESLNAFQGALGGVADAVDMVFSPSSQTKRAFVPIRPPGHHCSADYPSGFCWINNVHIGIEYAAQAHSLTHAVILDFDLHHGDGSQAITWERNSINNVKRMNAKPNSKVKLGPDIGYYSLHDINSYPCEMGDDEKVQAASLCLENAHGQSIWNVHLQPWKTEKEFWDLYETRYRILLDKAKVFLQHHTLRLKSEGKVSPKAAIFISAGFDASEWEGAGMQRHKVNVPTEFYARFTRDVVELAGEEGLACDGRIISVLEGGYSDRALCSGVLSHLSALCARPIDALKTEPSVVDDLDQMMRGLGINGTGTSNNFYYNKAWWSPANLTALENKINPPPPPQVKKARVGQQPTYATPTESFAYKVVDANKFARSISGTMREVPQPARPPTPPPPEVDWVTATQELSKLLIPSNRQTKSCSPEELAVPKVKKDLAATMAAFAINDSNPRQLRDRKSKAPAYAGSAHSDELESVRSASRGSRRQTIAELPSASNQTETSHQRRASRRLSAGSTLSSLADFDADAPPVPALPNNVTRVPGTMQPPTLPSQAVPAKKTRALPKKEASSSAPGSPKRVVKPPPRLSGPATAAATSGRNDIDALTTGMKKVTLKVGSKEEHERKQKEKLDAERRTRALKAAETRKANAAAKKAAKESSLPVAKSGVQGTEHQAKENFAPMSINRNNVLVDHFAPVGPPSNQSIEMTDESRSTPILSTSLPVNPPPNDDMLPVTVASDATQSTLYAQQYEIDPSIPPLAQPPAGTAHSVSQHIPAIQNTGVLADSEAHAVPSHVQSTSSPARSPHGVKLPVWSSTGVIPFAATHGSLGTRPVSSLEAANVPAETNNGNAVNTKSVATSIESAPAVKSEGQEASIWDVPDTPRR